MITEYIIFFQISTNVIISPLPSSSEYLVAPFWADVDIRNGVGDISYQVYSIGSPLLDTVNTIISDEENINFIGHWMLVAEWDGVREYKGSPNQVNITCHEINICNENHNKI